MMDPIIEFFESMLHWLRRTIATFVAWLFWPFVAMGRWYKQRGFILRLILGGFLLFVAISYLWFAWNTMTYNNLSLNYASKIEYNPPGVSAGEQVAAEGGTDTTKTCGRSAIVDVSMELVDFNVNQNTWVSASLIYRLGLFGIPWDATPWFDNKASFQRGIHRAVTRTSVELADALGRVRGSSKIDPDLQKARSNLQINEFNWYVGLSPFGVKQTAWGSYRQALTEFGRYNDRLEACGANFDARGDNLMQFLDRIAKDIGSASAEIKDRAEQYNGGWFDTRADNVFMESRGQLYAYLGLLKAARRDFSDIVENRNLGSLWDNMEAQLMSALMLEPLIISNGKEDGAFMPTHLTTMGFYILRVRTNLTELRDVLRN